MTTEITRRSMLGMTVTTAATALSALSASNWIFAFDEDGSVVKAATKNGQWSPDFFSNKEITQLETLCETIIPKTDTAGASEARVHEYIDLLYSVDSEENQDRVKNGLKWLDKRCKKIQKSNIAKASPEQLIGLLEPLSDTKNSHPSELEIGVDLFRDLKAKTITGYYTSKEGRVEELGLPEHTIMTTYDGCTHGGEH
jgi:DNA-binding transcriptional regulator YhcF (GntR family)